MIVDQVIGIAVAVMVLAAIIIVKVLIDEIERQRKPTFNGRLLQKRIAQLRTDLPNRSERWYLQKGQRDLSNRKPQSPVAKVDGKTRLKLYSLVNGDQKTASRLIETVRYRNPNRSEQWCWEKVIYDLERDRRA